MTAKNRNKFTAKIDIIGVNPFVFIPKKNLEALFAEAKKDKGKIQIKIKIEGHEFNSNIGKIQWKLAIIPQSANDNIANKDVGDEARFEISFDPNERVVPMHFKLQEASEVSSARNKKIFCKFKNGSYD